MLAIVHVSSRYNVSAVLDEARDVFPNTMAPRDFDLVEIPFPERGEPELIQEGAKQRPEPLAEPAPGRRLTLPRSAASPRRGLSGRCYAGAASPFNPVPRGQEGAEQ